MPDYFTLGELRALPDMSDDITYPEVRVEAAAAHIVGIIEREVGTSFVGRSITETHRGGTEGIVLDKLALSVTSATEDGVTATGLYLQDNVVYRLTGGWPRAWSRGFNNIVVTYQGGYSATPPPDVKEMALKGTRAHLIATANEAGSTDRRTSVSTEMGVETWSVAGKDAPTGYPEVDAMILGWQERLDIGSFA